MVKPPCKDCEDREVGCHSSCIKYKVYKLKNDAIREKARQKRHDENIAREVEHNRVMKILRRRGKK